MIALRQGDVDAFFDTPFVIYDRSVGYVSPMRGDIRRMLDADRNPLLVDGNPFAFWTAHRGGHPVGRIVAVRHGQSNALHGTRGMQFGFFDVADDPEAAAALLGAAEGFARTHDCDEIAGNFNLTAMQQAGVMTEGFGVRAFTDMIVNPPHVPRLLEANGYARFFPMTTFTLDIAAAQDAHLRAVPDGYAFQPITRSAFPLRMEQARTVLNDGFADNPMFVPLTIDEFEFQAGEMSAILDPRLSSILTHEGRPVGVVVCIPDLNGFLSATHSRIGLATPFHFLRHRLMRRRAVIIFYSVVQDQHGRGLMGGMLKHLIGTLRDARYRELGITWIADVNAASLRQMERIGAKPAHRLHLFRKALA